MAKSKNRRKKPLKTPFIKLLAYVHKGQSLGFGRDKARKILKEMDE